MGIFLCKAMKIEDCISEVSTALGPVKHWERLPGDASNRSYCRIWFEGFSSPRILMINALEAFKSEEAGSGSSPSSKETDFQVIAEDWHSQGIRVPRLIYSDSEMRFLVIEDFGDQLLYDLRQKDSALKQYEQAIEELVKIHALKPCNRISERSFSSELFDWEVEHFIEFAMEERSKGEEKDKELLREFFYETNRKLASLPYLVTHRDFHSKNILVLQDSIGIIDFQDALMGPAVYDLASLLRDSYVRLKPEEEERLLQIYEAKAGPVDRQMYGLMSLQRNLKAIGRFFYIYFVKSRNTHLPFIAPTTQRVLKTLEELGEPEILKVMETVLEPA